MATSASARNGRDSNPQYLGVKAYDGQLLKASSASAEPRFIPVRTSARAATSPSSPSRTAR